MQSTTDDPILTDRFDAALKFALDHHRTQVRKDTRVPYAAHLLAVAAISMEIGDGEDEAIAALLHDVVEDGGGPEAAAEISQQFGDDVHRIVIANSDSTEPGPDGGKAPWRGRKEKYLAAIPAKRADEVRVSIADKLHNARSILADLERHGGSLWDRFNADRDGVLWYYRSLVMAFEDRRGDIGEPAGTALTELARVVAAIEAVAGE